MQNLSLQSNYNKWKNLPTLNDCVSYFGEIKKFRGRTGIVYQYGYSNDYVFVEFVNGICACKIDELYKIEL